MNTGRVDWAPDYGEPRLFDPATTTPTRCPVGSCGAIRFPGQDRVPTCDVDRQRATGDWVRRPKACLNQHDPATASIPY